MLIFNTLTSFAPIRVCALPPLLGMRGIDARLSYGIVAHTRFHQCKSADHRNRNVLGLVVLVMTDELHAIFLFGFVDVLDRYEFISVDISRDQVHFPPKNTVLHVAYLLVKDNIAAFK